MRSILLLLANMYLCSTAGADGSWPSDAPFARMRLRPRSCGVDICAPPSLAPDDAPALQLAPVSTAASSAGTPSGHVDAANATLVGGVALDPDSPSTHLAVQIRLDGVLWDQQLTTGSSHRFSWAINQILGSAATNHTVSVVALGVDSSGMPDGMDAVLPGVKGISGSCAPIPEDCGPPGGTPVQEQCALGAWCYDVVCYWQHRPTDTRYVDNALVRCVQTSYLGGWSSVGLLNLL